MKICPAVTSIALFAVVAPLAAIDSPTFVPEVPFVFVTLIVAPVTVCALVPFAPDIAMFSPSTPVAPAVEVEAMLTIEPEVTELDEK